MSYVPKVDGFRAPPVATPIRRPIVVVRRDSHLQTWLKRAFDLGFSTVVLLPALIVVACVLLAVNPFLNPGPLFYAQKRMGRGCKPFRAYKFRTMDVRPRGIRGPDDPIEIHRIRPVGNLLRKSRFDELPQILNVYRGEMSLIGPRPDYFRHASRYLHTIPGYRERHAVLPGISGLSQVRHGYAAGHFATRLKTRTDLEYIRHGCFRLDMWIVWRTMVTVFRMRGA
ncbi:sugar transferase [Roseicyclus marinus]|uniref:sugar transferase n=1 Tax=Roseicyclus marinus TaxID=2161673 RepID=UPI00240FBAB8|nr:sugar transferase [Roseicyclus marinus]MDG3042248.1 sugar transferase [Roseicyclus marinus]